MNHFFNNFINGRIENCVKEKRKKTSYFSRLTNSKVYFALSHRRNLLQWRVKLFPFPRSLIFCVYVDTAGIHVLYRSKNIFFRSIYRVIVYGFMHCQHTATEYLTSHRGNESMPLDCHCWCILKLFFCTSNLAFDF